MLTFDVNWIAIIVAIVANMVIGAAWFAMFASPWMAGVGKTREEIEQDQDWRPYGVAILNSFLMAFVLANVIAWTGATGLVGGLVTGLIMWVGFTGFTFAVNHAFEGRSLLLWLINSGTFLVGLMVMGAILGVWR